MPQDKWTHPIKLIEARQAQAKSNLKSHGDPAQEDTAEEKEVKEFASSMIKDFPVSSETACKNLNKEKELKINQQANFLKEFRALQDKKDARKAMLRPQAKGKMLQAQI